ncbi:MAG: hypothetical protein E7012_03565 [Alphaproteobacteria bacterium]|nr:hypothetical protein [Alphaproteobacteria bacterium]
MTFMSLFGKDCIEMDKLTGENLAPVLFTVAMQRLSKGAVLHAPVHFNEQLPFKFWSYSSAHDDYHIMTDDCLQFIYKGLPIAAQFKPTSDYALKIAWGLAEHLNENGNCLNGFELYCNNPVEEGKKLYAKAIEIIEKNVSAKDIFSRYSKPNQWQKHKVWLRSYLSKNNCWNDFFKRIEVSASLSNLCERIRIKREIKRA